jgi:hypothetical protein
MVCKPRRAPAEIGQEWCIALRDQIGSQAVADDDDDAVHCGAPSRPALTLEQDTLPRLEPQPIAALPSEQGEKSEIDDRISNNDFLIKWLGSHDPASSGNVLMKAGCL